MMNSPCLVLPKYLSAGSWQAFDDVLITEFMAANNGPVLDEDGDASDWIEIHNNGTNTVEGVAYFDRSTRTVYAAAVNSSQSNGFMFLGSTP